MKRLLLVLVIPALALAAVPWSQEEIQRNMMVESRNAPGFQGPKAGAAPSPRLSPNYLYEIQQTCDFVAHYQFSDSSKPDSFGGIIEAEHMPTTIETDNTQEAIWVWTRWYELTGTDAYRTNIRRAWYYVMNHPAYREGTGQYVWYSIWNCGLAFFAEMKYREVYGDSSHLAYTDTCRQYLYAHPLNFASNTLYGNVTALAAGMMYRYAVERGDMALRDSALAYGNRVRSWVDAGPARLRTGNWAMSGGTLLWGICNSIWRNDTVAGKAWLQTYADSVPYFMPSGQWNCSWNIWDANGFWAANEIGHDAHFNVYHQHLTDTLLGRDLDDDGGIPATWTDAQNQDQTWVSMYLDFMGMDRFVNPLLDHDLAVVDIVGFDPNHIYFPGDSIQLGVVVANLSRSAITADVTLRMPGYSDTKTVMVPFLGTDTVQFNRWGLSSAGLYPLLAFTGPDDNPANDSVAETLKVWQPRNIAGQLADSGTARGIRAGLKLYLLGDTVPCDTALSDTLGRFTFLGIDSTFEITCHPEIPYPDRQWSAAVHGDTIWQFRINPARLLLVDRDTSVRFEPYYLTTFDTLALNYCRWRRADGSPAVEPLTRLRDRLVVWYSGNALTGTLDSSDMDSLSRFLNMGGRLLITGQNIGQEIRSTDFYQNRLHARLVNPSVSLFYLFNNAADSLGALFGPSQTAGTGGANNQYSRDEIAPDSLSHTFMFYDTTSRGAGICYHDPVTQSRLIYLGFGFEAVNRPSNHPSFMSRVTFFNQCYAWLTGLSGIADGAPAYDAGLTTPLVYPNPFRDQVILRIPPTADRQPQELRIYDSSGRLAWRVRTPVQNPKSKVQNQTTVTWDGRNSAGRLLPSGVYYYRVVPGIAVGGVQLIR